MAAEVIGGLAASYLIVTLTATSLAKLHRWRGAALGLVRATAVPVVAAPLLIIAVSAAELVLATLLVFGVWPRLTGGTIACLFLLFGGYRIVVAARTRTLICSCAGAIRIARATPSAVAGDVAACLVQASLGYTWMLLGNRASGGVLQPLEVVAWIAPFIVMFAGVWKKRAAVHRQVAIL